MTAVGWIGVWLLAAAVALIVMELGWLGFRLLRLRRQVLAVELVLAREEAVRGVELRRLRVLQAQLNELMRPYRRGRRWLFHPLTVAMMESYRRRRARS